MRDIWGRDQVVAYFERIEATLADIRSIASDLPADVVLSTALRGFQRLNRALERVDDSGGHRWAVQHDLRELHIHALSRLDWSPDQLAEHLLDLTLEDPADQFTNLLEHYAEVLGEPGQAAFFALVESRLDALPALTFGADFNEASLHLRLVDFLQERAEAADDVPALIALAKRTCTSVRDYYRISALYLRLPDLDEALAWVDKADAVGEVRGRELALRVAVHTAREEWSAALAVQRRVFESEASASAYRTLQDLAERVGNAQLERTEAQNFLRSHLQGLPWQRERYAATLAAILREEGNLLEAYEVVREHVVDPDNLLEVMPWFEDQAPELRAALVTLG